MNSKKHRMAGKTAAVLAALCLIAPGVRADIYSVWPFDDSRTAGIESGAAPAKNFWKENIFVNGMPLTLEIALIDTPLAELAGALKKALPEDAVVFANSNSLLVQEMLKDNAVRRGYYLQLSGVYPVLRFTVELPKERRKMTASMWPEEIPLPPGAADLTCMRFPARNASYGSFLLREIQPHEALAVMSSLIQEQGWERVSREADHVFKGSGEVFLKSGAGAILILGVVPLPRGEGVRVSVYTRPLE